jgi:hypothetical protein
MNVLRYFAFLSGALALGILTVSEHVEQVRLGYEIRRLERSEQRLRQERKARQLIWERHAALESLAKRAEALGLIDAAELEALLSADNQARRGA